MPPSRLVTSAIVARRQRRSRLEPLEFDTGARASPQQPVGCLAQRRPAFDAVLCQGGVKRSKEGGDIAIDPGTKLAVDRGAIAGPARHVFGFIPRRWLAVFRIFAWRRIVSCCGRWSHLCAAVPPVAIMRIQLRWRAVG